MLLSIVTNSNTYSNSCMPTYSRTLKHFLNYRDIEFTGNVFFTLYTYNKVDTLECQSPTGASMNNEIYCPK